MAANEPESFVEQLVRDVTLNLITRGGRVFVHGADGNSLDRCSIELKCTYSPGLMMFEQAIMIGNDSHKPFKWDDNGIQVADKDADDVVGWNIYDCAIILSVFRVDEKGLADSAAKTQGQPILGRFDFNEPVRTADGVVNDKRPTINAWIGLGPNNFQLLRDRIVATEEADFDLGIAVEFPPGSVKAGWVKRVVSWDGKGSLPIISATLLWLRSDWDSQSERESRILRSPEVVLEPPKEPDELLLAIRKLETVVSRLATPLWLAVAAAIVAAWSAR